MNVKTIRVRNAHQLVKKKKMKLLKYRARKVSLLPNNIYAYRGTPDM